jgi:HEAT repeat protein
MKFRSKMAWLVAAPAAWITGCSLGPVGGWSRDAAVISLQTPEPLVALERSGTVRGLSAEEGAFSTAEWRGGDASDPETSRLFQLAAARRRMNQQIMMQMLMQPTLVTPPQPRPTPNGSSSSTTAQKKPSPAGSGTSTAPRTTATPRPTGSTVTPVPPLSMAPMTPYALPELPPFMPPPRRLARQERQEQRTSRVETASSVEANRIERAAAAEAERAEKAALAEAQLAERKLLAEAELVERMTRAETELAERIAAAKDERDRRIEIARQERELRLAILGLNPEELGKDPAAEALAKISKPKPPAAEESSAFTRFTRLLRTRGEQIRGPGESEPSREGSADTQGTDRQKSSEERLREAADSVLDTRTLAQVASALPSGAPESERASSTPRDARGGTAAGSPTEQLHPSLLADWSAANHSTTGESSSAPANSGWETRSWSLLDDLPQAPVAAAERQPASATVAQGSPPEFPELPSRSPATEPADRLPPARDADANALVRRDPTIRTPENDLWILGSRRPQDAGTDTAPFPETRTARPYDATDYTQPRGLFAESGEAASQADRTPVDGLAAGESPRSSLLDGILTTHRTGSSLPTEDVPVDPAFARTPSHPSVGAGSSDPWLHTSPATAAVAHAAPVFPNQPVPPAPADLLPTAPQSVMQATWTQQSLLDVCDRLPADLQALVAQLDIPEAGVRKEVLHDLGQLGARARPALPAIRVLLEDHPLIAAHAAWTIWNITNDEREATRELVRLIQTGQPEVVQFAAYALGSLGPKALSITPALRVAREQFNGATRLHIAEALVRIDAFDDASVQVLISALNAPEPHQRWLGALALGHVQARHSVTVVPALVTALQDADPEVRSAAALSLGGFGPAAAAAIPELQRRATLDSPTVREAAQTALACIRR